MNENAAYYVEYSDDPDIGDDVRGLGIPREGDPADLDDITRYTPLK